MGTFLDAKTTTGALVRTALVFVFGYFVKKGLIDNEQAEWLAGTVLALGVLVWSLIAKSRAKKEEVEKVAIAIKAPDHSTVAEIDEKHAELKEQNNLPEVSPKP